IFLYGIYLQISKWQKYCQFFKSVKMSPKLCALIKVFCPLSYEAVFCLFSCTRDLLYKPIVVPGLGRPLWIFFGIKLIYCRTNIGKIENKTFVFQFFASYSLTGIE